MADKMDENDPSYALKKWGPLYSTRDEYWKWRHQRDKDENARRDAEFSPPEKDTHASLPYPRKIGW